MRVLESKPVVTQTMGKKKHKLRKQSKENKLCPGSDSSDEATLQGATAGNRRSEAISDLVITILSLLGVCSL